MIRAGEYFAVRFGFPASLVCAGGSFAFAPTRGEADAEKLAQIEAHWKSK